MTRSKGMEIKEPVHTTWAAIEHTLESDIFVGKPEDDESRGWNRIEKVKEKSPRNVFADTKKMVLYLGCRESRRLPEAREGRYNNPEGRAQRHRG